MLLSELASRDIAILGAGREGLAAWRWLRRHFPDKGITIYDEGPGNRMQDESFAGSRNRLVRGPFMVETLARHDLLIRSPGISPYRSELTALRKAGTRFTSASNLWFAQHPDEKTICITGTKGKSTTAALTAHLLSAAGCRVQFAGNIGQPLLDCTDIGIDWWVIELSSYQLVDLQARPTVAAILNLTDEHLDWHGGTVAYQHDKLRLASLCGGAPLIVNHADELLARRLRGQPNLVWFGHEEGYFVRENQLWHGKARIENLPRTSLRGPHNLANLAAALTIVEQTGENSKKLLAALDSFAALPHRLQSLGCRDGVEYVNDSLSTTPVATLAALEALQGSRIILLAGGMDRGVDWRPSVPKMKETVPYAVICMPDSGPDIAAVLRESGLDAAGGIDCADDLAQAVQMAARLARPGDTVLLSPGAPSFPRFADYADRGRRFAKLAGFSGFRDHE